MESTDVLAGPKVSVSLVTYNQEDFITQAIDSVLCQKASFQVELVIGEDCSTDRTRDIVTDYARRYPDKIRLVLQPRNRGLLGNFQDTFEACRAEYVALLDGDDYWTSLDKLERQVCFLDSHLECSICFHNVAVLLPDQTFCAENYTSTEQRPISSLRDLFEANFIATCSAMLRRAVLPRLPEWYATSVWEDWPLYILFAEHGDIGYLDEVMSVYRSHGRGLWSRLALSAQLEESIRFLRTMDDHLGYRHSARIQECVTQYRARLASLRITGQR